MSHWTPADRHVAELLKEAEWEAEGYNPEEISGLIEDLCSAIRRAHFRIEQMEREKGKT